MRIRQQFREGTISDHHCAIVLKVRADSKAPDNFDLAAVELARGWRRVHPQKSAGTAIDNARLQLAQILQASLELRQRQDRLIGIEGEHPDEKILTIGGVAPEYTMPVCIKRPGACNARYNTNRFQVSSRKWVFRCKPILAGALKKDIPIEQRDNFERSIKKGLFKTELH